MLRNKHSTFLVFLPQDAETAALQHQLDHLIDSAYRMTDSYERQCERQADQVAFDSAIAAFTETDRLSERRSLDAYSSSDQESFVSATDVSIVFKLFYEYLTHARVTAANSILLGIMFICGMEHHCAGNLKPSLSLDQLQHI